MMAVQLLTKSPSPLESSGRGASKPCPVASLGIWMTLATSPPMAGIPNASVVPNATKSPVSSMYSMSKPAVAERSPLSKFHRLT